MKSSIAMTATGRPRSFLVIQTAFLGDAVLATALLEKMHAFFPEAAIDLVVRKGNEGLFEQHPFLRRLHIWDKRTNKTRDLFRLIGELRKERYDHAINCQRFFSTGFMTMRCRADEKVGYDKNPLSLFFDRVVKHRIPQPQDVRPYDPQHDHTHAHEVDRLNDLIEHLTDKSRPLPTLYPTALHEDEARRAVSTGTSYITMAPASVWYTKQWPMEKWVELIKVLPTDRRVLLIGAPGDAALCARIAKAAGRGEVLAGTLSLLATAVLMRDAAMNYVNDSAPLHIASAMRAPARAVFCSTVPAFGFGPLHANGSIVELDHVLDCRPCGLHGYKACPKGHFKCAVGIDAVSVVKGA